MSRRFSDSGHAPGAPGAHGRREVLKAGAALVAAPLMGSAATRVQAAQSGVPVDDGPFSVRAYGATSATSPIGPLQIPRRALGRHDVLLDVLYCGICHSDIHVVRNEWAVNGYRVNYPCVPGHEIVGRVAAIGSSVAKFKVGDIGGVGCIVDACGTCENCLADLENYCLNGWTLVFNAPDRISGGHHYGGFRSASSSPSASLCGFRPG